MSHCIVLYCIVLYCIVLYCIVSKISAVYFGQLPVSRSLLKSFLCISINAFFTSRMVSSGCAASRCSKTRMVGLKLPYHFRRSVRLASAFSSCAKCLQFFTAFITLSKRLAIFSKVSGWCFMKADNRDAWNKKWNCELFFSHFYFLMITINKAKRKMKF